MYKLEFLFDYKGYGTLKLYNDDKVEMQYAARTGSIGTDGKPKFQIPTLGTWTIKDRPVSTFEENMYVTFGNGWKVRLYTPDGRWTHYLIHPIQHGTKGCIGLIGTDAIPLKDKLFDILDTQKSIDVIINKRMDV